MSKTIKADVKLTAKQKAFADNLINNPKMSPTQSALQAYGKPDKPTTYGSAQQIAHENLTKPNIQIYLNKHIDKAKQKIVNLLDSENEQIVLASSKDILDRTFGKPSQKTDSTSVSYIQHVSDKRTVYNL
jgi:phage terminase small subunit